MSTSRLEELPVSDEEESLPKGHCIDTTLRAFMATSGHDSVGKCSCRSKQTVGIESGFHASLTRAGIFGLAVAVGVPTSGQVSRPLVPV